MEKVHVLSEVEQLKEQVSPELLFKTLHHSGELTLSEPEKASKMLMKLSQLLRYQLYDCSRTKVLLSSEINFLNNYLTLEQNSQAQFNYELLADGALASGRADYLNKSSSNAERLMILSCQKFHLS